MSDCAHISGYHYAGMEMKRFELFTENCDDLKILNFAKVQIDGAQRLANGDVQYARLFSDLDIRRKMIEERWKAITPFPMPVILTP